MSLCLVFRCFKIEIKQWENFGEMTWVPRFNLTERKTLLFIIKKRLQVKEILESWTGGNQISMTLWSIDDPVMLVEIWRRRRRIILLASSFSSFYFALNFLLIFVPLFHSWRVIITFLEKWRSWHYYSCDLNNCLLAVSGLLARITRHCWRG